MLIIPQITNAPNQQLTVSLPDGSSFVMNLYYMPQQYGWFITNFVYGDFTLNSLRITNNPNMLRQWKNSLAFGLACFSTSLREPTQQNDFASGASNLYVLTAAEVQAYEEFLAHG